MPITDAQETCTMAPEKLVPVSGTYDMQSLASNFFGTRFWYRIEHDLFGARNCYQFLVPVSGTGFLNVCHWHKMANDRHDENNQRITISQQSFDDRHNLVSHIDPLHFIAVKISNPWKSKMEYGRHFKSRIIAITPL